ncbi:MAG TPA: D-erythronate dehydrogenase [Geminicoccaceae bacterium]
MRIVITGGAGFIGKKLAQALLTRGTLTDGQGRVQTLTEIVLFDVVEPEGLLHDDPRLLVRTGDIGDAGQVRELIGRETGGVFHLAAIVSANAEEDFDLGMRVNLDGTRHVLEACRALGTCPKLVFASSVAVYGAVEGMPDDSTVLTPQTSYGAQKAIGELLVNDYTRKGFIDGRALRLPTIVVRPGKPNKAASTFASSILREPLAGQEAICPVRPEAAMYVLSPRRVIQALLHAFELPGDKLGQVRMLTLPGISVSVGEMANALKRVAGEEVAARIRWELDPTIQKIVSGWIPDIKADRARALGFDSDRDMDEIVRAHIEDELAGHVA